MRTKDYLTLILLIFAMNVATAAKKSFSGFVVTTEQDTLFGSIFVVSPTANELKVKFIDENKNKYNFKARDLESYAFDVPKYDRELKKHTTERIEYIRKTVEDAPIRFGTTDILVERQVNGDIQVYNQYIEADEKIGGTLAHFFYVESQGKVDFTKITKKNYKDIMKKATADFMELNQKIGQKGFGYKHIVKIAQLYNQNKSNRRHAN